MLTLPVGVIFWRLMTRIERACTSSFFKNTIEIVSSLAWELIQKTRT
jgi:hypothetical protein